MAGIAHELNQPLTAVLANAQAAQRLLAEEAHDPADLQLAREAMGHAANQARRAADVVGRLRRAIERPDAQATSVPSSLAEAARSALHLLEPECARRQIRVELEQIVHNLLTNAMQALDQQPARARQIWLRLGREGNQGLLQVTNSDPGITTEVLPRLFQPFFSTREGGLGLSLCETLALGMGGVA